MDEWPPVAVFGPRRGSAKNGAGSVQSETDLVRREWFAIPLLVGAGLVQWAYYVWVEPLKPMSGGESRYFAHVIGSLLLGATLLLRDLPMLRRFGNLGRHTYFVFLGHIVVLDALNAQLQEAPSFGTIGLSVLVTVGIFCFGLVLGPVFARVPLLKLLYPR
jgi:hypothetical protein